MDSKKDCPVCFGSGNDPDGCNCRCFTKAERAVISSVCCVNVDCQGCGGICCYCGGTGKKKDWKPGGPYPQDYEPDEEKG
jgi:hypothetical protein